MSAKSRSIDARNTAVAKRKNAAFASALTKALVAAWAHEKPAVLGDCLTPRQTARLLALARSRKMSVNEFVRSLILGGTEPPLEGRAAA